MQEAGAPAVESAAVDQQGDFSAVASPGDTLPIAGVVEFTATDGNTVTVASVTTTEYCINADNASLPGETWSFNKLTGAPVEGAC